MIKKLFRYFLILLVSFILGVAYNQIHSKGIRWSVISPARAFGQKLDNRFQVIPADSAFVFFKNESTIFFDIRSLKDYQIDHIPGAYHVSLNDILDERLNVETAGKRCVVYNQEGELEEMEMAVSGLLDLQCRNVYSIFGGYLSWISKGYPVEGGESLR